VGRSARVTYSNGLPVRIRRTPEFAERFRNVVGQLPEGAAMQVLGGPLCARNPQDGQNYIFWQVRALQGNLEGWAVEGEPGNYYLEPIP
jgi:hypothetical protein